MTTRPILTQDEIHTLLRNPNQSSPLSAPTPLRQHATPPTEAPKPSGQANDQVLSTIQSELRQIRSLMASRTGLGLSSHTSSPVKYKILERLTTFGFQLSACEKLLQGLNLASDETTAWQQIMLSLETQLPISREHSLDQPSIIAFVGPTGSGKTTGIAKLATAFIQRHNAQDIGLITTDCFSVAGRDQLSTYGRLLDIPVHKVNNTTDFNEALTHLSQKRFILIDTPGISHKDPQFTEALSIILQSSKPIKTILTLPATTHEKLLSDIVSAFHFTQISGVSITKIDEAPFIGHVLSTCIDYQLPVFSLTNGQHIPQNFKLATLEAVLNYLFNESSLTTPIASEKTQSTYHATVTEATA